MKPLTPEQQDMVVLVRPMGLKIAQIYARRYGHDDWCSHVMLSLCQRIHSYDPAKITPMKWGQCTAHFACRHLMARRMRAWRENPTVALTDKMLDDLAAPEVKGDIDQTAELLLATLCPRDRFLLEGFYFRHRTLVSLAAELGISVHRVNHLKARAIASLRVS